MFGMSDMHFTSVRYQLLGKKSLAGRYREWGMVVGGSAAAADIDEWKYMDTSFSFLIF